MPVYFWYIKYSHLIKYYKRVLIWFIYLLYPYPCDYFYNVVCYDAAGTQIL